MHGKVEIISLCSFFFASVLCGPLFYFERGDRTGFGVGAKKDSLARDIEDLIETMKKIKDPALRSITGQFVAAVGIYYAERERQQTRLTRLKKPRGER